MKMSTSLVVALGMGMAVSVFADEQTPDATAIASANCFDARASGESFEDCIRRVARNAAVIEAAAKAGQQRARLTQCFSDCESPDCMRACLPVSLATIASKRGGQTVRDVISTVETKTPFYGPTLKALDNVRICADIFLAPGGEDYEGFWVCVGSGVVQRFLSSVGFKSGTSIVSPTQVWFTLYLIIEMSEDMAETNGSPDRTTRLRAKRYEANAESPTTPQQDEVSFEVCVQEWHNDRHTCDESVGSDEQLLKECYKGAGVRFTACCKDR